MPQLSFADTQKLSRSEFDALYPPGKIESLPAPRSLEPIEMAALITASVEFWKFRVKREGPFGADFPTISDVAGELYLAIAGIPVEQGAPSAVLCNTETPELDPAVLAAAIAATVEVWRASFQDFNGYHSPAAPRRQPIEVVAAQVRAAIDVLKRTAA